MGQSREVHGTGQWYLIARHGDMVMRVLPRMLIGETASGELSFDQSCAQLELDIDDDGGLVLSAIDGHELEWAGGTRCHRERLARHRGAEIRLAHNVLILDTDFVQDDPAPRAIEDVIALDAEQAQAPEGLQHRPTAVVPDVESPKPKAAVQPIVNARSKELPNARARARRPRIPSPSMAALVTLAAVGLGWLYFGLRDDATPKPDDTVATGPTQEIASSEATSATTITSQQREDALPSAAASPPETLSLPTGQISLSSEPRVADQVAKPPAEGVSIEAHDTLPGLAESAPAAMPAAKDPPPSEPVVRASAERPSVPKVAQSTTTPKAKVPVAKAIDVAPKDTVAKRPQPQKDEADEKRAADLARQRALFAADQALAQGRLTTPPEANAYALYNRVLTLDPESPEARNGLKSVREKLINRALAELAGNALDDARRSLEAATEVGADPSLVANLQDEVAYRQQLINARKDNE